MSFIRKAALLGIKRTINQFQRDLRPETRLSRIKEFYEPRRFETYDKQIMGLHGYGIKDLRPVKELKKDRLQSHLYDFELTEKLNALHFY
jgi:hypothetical protein